MPDHDYPSRFLTISEAHRRGHLPWSRTRTYQLIADGHLCARKDGRNTLIDLASVDAYFSRLPEFTGATAEERASNPNPIVRARTRQTTHPQAKG